VPSFQTLFIKHENEQKHRPPWSGAPCAFHIQLSGRLCVMLFRRDSRSFVVVGFIVQGVWGQGGGAVGINLNVAMPASKCF
jgi:hypothetical protein